MERFDLFEENGMGLLRILQVVTYMGRGGLETMLMNYYRQIDHGRIQFDFLTHREERWDYDDEIEEFGGMIYRLPPLNPFSATYKSALNEFFDNHPEYQIIHVHQDCLSSVILKIAKKHGVKVRIAHSHSSSQDKNIKYLIKLYYKRFIPKYSTYQFACSKEAGNWMFNGSEFEVLNNAIDAKNYSYNIAKRIEMRKRLYIPENTILIGHVGRFCYPKNHTFLIDIFAHLCRQKQAYLLLVGDGELRLEIEKKVEALHLENKVIFTGIRSDVADLMQAMDVFVFPSNYEGLPVTMVEAQAAGLPCIISDKVPAECIKTNLVKQLPLTASTEEWVHEIIASMNIERRDTYEEIKESGFDIKENANKLMDFYFRQLG